MLKYLIAAILALVTFLAVMFFMNSKKVIEDPTTAAITSEATTETPTITEDTTTENLTTIEASTEAPTSEATMTTTATPSPVTAWSFTLAQVQAADLTAYSYDMTISTQKGDSVRTFEGARLRDVLQWLGASVKQGDELKVTSGDGSFTVISYAMAMADNTLLAWNEGGAPIGSLRLCPGNSTASNDYVKDVVHLSIA